MYTYAAYMLIWLFLAPDELTHQESTGAQWVNQIICPCSHCGQANFSACPVRMHTQSNTTNIIFTQVHNTNTHKKYHILEYIDIEGTRLSSEIIHQLEPLWPRLAQLLEPITNIGRGFDSQSTSLPDADAHSE